MNCIRRTLLNTCLLAIMLAIAGPLHSTSMTLTGVGSAPGAATYTGPGDVQATGWVYWAGLRAFSAAKRGTKAINLCDDTGANCSDVLTDATTGALNSPGTHGTNNCNTSATCKIHTVYDQSGNTNCTGSVACDFVQTTTANQPVLVMNCNGSTPCISYVSANSQKLVTTATVASSFSQPYSGSITYQRLGQFSNITDVFVIGNAEIFGWQTADTINVYAGSFVNTTVADANWNAINATWNNSVGTNDINVNGTLSNYAGGAGATGATTSHIVGLNSNTAPTMHVSE
jgi:hypothetical protein